MSDLSPECALKRTSAESGGRPLLKVIDGKPTWKNRCPIQNAESGLGDHNAKPVFFCPGGGISERLYLCLRRR